MAVCLCVCVCPGLYVRATLLEGASTFWLACLCVSVPVYSLNCLVVCLCVCVSAFGCSFVRFFV